MTIPMIWGILAIIVVTITDTFFVAQLGTLPLAAMGFVFPVAMAAFSLGIGLSAGAGSVLARAIGGSTHRQVRRLATDALTISFLISVLFVTAGLLTIEPVFRMLGAGDDTIPLITDYMIPTYISIVFLIVPMTGNSILRAGGDAKWPGTIMLISSVINAVLDPILIFGLLGFPRLEIAGAAWATMASRIFILISILAILHYRERLIDSPWPGMKAYRASVRKIMHIAMPAAMNQMLNPLAMAALTALVAAHGAGAVAAFGVATRIEGFALVVLYALSAAIGPVAGQNWGAGLPDRSREALLITFRFCMIFGFGGAALVALTAPLITPWFDPDPAISGQADTYLRIVVWSYAFHGCVMMSVAFFNSIGHPGSSLALTILRMAVLMVPLAYIGSRMVGIEGIFWAIALANTGAGLLAIFWPLKVCNRTIKM